MQQVLDEGLVTYEDYAIALDKIEVNPRYGELIFDGQIMPEIAAASYPWLIPAASVTAVTAEVGGAEIVPETAQ
jgi:hypothetical protein